MIKLCSKEVSTFEVFVQVWFNRVCLFDVGSSQSEKILALTVLRLGLGVAKTEATADILANHTEVGFLLRALRDSKHALSKRLVKRSQEFLLQFIN